MESDLEDFDEDSMDTLYTEEDEEHMEWSESPEYLLSLFSNLESTWEVMGYNKIATGLTRVYQEITKSLLRLYQKLDTTLPRVCFGFISSLPRVYYWFI